MSLEDVKRSVIPPHTASDQDLQAVDYIALDDLGGRRCRRDRERQDQSAGGEVKLHLVDDCGMLRWSWKEGPVFIDIWPLNLYVFFQGDAGSLTMFVAVSRWLTPGRMPLGEISPGLQQQQGRKECITTRLLQAAAANATASRQPKGSACTRACMPTIRVPSTVQYSPSFSNCVFSDCIYPVPRTQIHPSVREDK